MFLALISPLFLPSDTASVSYVVIYEVADEVSDEVSALCYFYLLLLADT